MPSFPGKNTGLLDYNRISLSSEGIMILNYLKFHHILSTALIIYWLRYCIRNECFYIIMASPKSVAISFSV